MFTLPIVHELNMLLCVDVGDAVWNDMFAEMLLTADLSRGNEFTYWDMLIN